MIEERVNQTLVYDGTVVGHTYDAPTRPTGMIDDGLLVAPAGNQDPPKPNDLDTDEPRFIDRKKD